MPIYIASFKLRGEYAECPKNCLKLNVTSCQRKDSEERRDFSPMSRIKDGYEGYFSFENYWQGGKVYEGIDYEITNSYFLNLNESKRRYPSELVKENGGGKITHAIYLNEEGNEVKYDYIESRKEIYVPKYFKLVKGSESMNKWKDLAEDHNIVVYDLDGPKDDGNVTCLKVTKKMLKEKINDPTYPFGHGYVVAGYLAGFKPKDYIE